MIPTLQPRGEHVNSVPQLNVKKAKLEPPVPNQERLARSQLRGVGGLVGGCRSVDVWEILEPRAARV